MSVQVYIRANLYYNKFVIDIRASFYLIKFILEQIYIRASLYQCKFILEQYYYIKESLYYSKFFGTCLY